MSNNWGPTPNNGQPTASLDRWLERMDLKGNPFGQQNAEGDLDLPAYFIDVGNFDEFLQLLSPCVVFAQRGCGKTAQRQMVAAHCRPLKIDSLRLAVPYTYSGFERVLESVNYNIEQVHSLHHVNALLYLGLTALVGEAKRDAKIQGSLESADVAPRFAAYIARFAPHLADVLTTEASSTLDGFSSVELLQGFSILARDTGLEGCIVLVDGLDEFAHTASDPALAVRFLAPLLGTLSLLECPGLAFKFFLPEELEPVLRLTKWFRTDRLHIVPIAWKEGDLLALIGQRLTHFSQRELPYEDLAQLCRDELAEVINRELATLAGALPRNALILTDMLLRGHCQQPDPPERIALETWKQVKESWLRDHGSNFVVKEATPDKQLSTFISDQPHLSRSEHPLLRVDDDKGFVWLGEHEIRDKIKAKEYSLLRCLYRHNPEVCSKEKIAEEAWPEASVSEAVSDQAIAACIARLRRVLWKFAPDSSHIETVRGRQRSEGGYRLHPRGLDRSVN